MTLKIRSPGAFRHTLAFNANHRRRGCALVSAATVLRALPTDADAAVRGWSGAGVCVSGVTVLRLGVPERTGAVVSHERAEEPVAAGRMCDLQLRCEMRLTAWHARRCGDLSVRMASSDARRSRIRKP